MIRLLPVLNALSVVIAGFAVAMLLPLGISLLYGDAARGAYAKAVVATGFPFRNKARMPRYRPVMEGALQHFEDLRRAGAAALDLAWTAAGTFDGYFELNLKPWDVAAGAALVREVGGRVSDWSGGDTWIETGDILAAPPAVHDVLLKLAEKTPQR